MKHLMATLVILISINSWADIEELPGMINEPTPEEILVYRSCFSKLESLGCGHPREDLERFRQCMNTSFESLDDSCRKTMKELYSN